MTVTDAKNVLHHPDRIFVLTALSYVNLTDRELEVLIYRHLKGHTQQETAEELDCSVNGLQNIEKTALLKCCAVWKNLIFIRSVMGWK